MKNCEQLLRDRTGNPGENYALMIASTDEYLARAVFKKVCGLGSVKALLSELDLLRRFRDEVLRKEATPNE